MSFLERINSILWIIRIKIYRKTSSVVMFRDNINAKYNFEKAKIPVLIRQIVEEDADKYCKARSMNSKKKMLERLSKGHIGMCAIHEGKIVCYVWQAIDEMWIDKHKINLKLPPKYRFGYDGYTHPEYRRLGIYHELLTTSYPYYLERGYHMSISLISSDNEASLKSSEKTDTMRLGTLHTTYFLGYVSHYIESDNEEDRKQIKTIFNLE